MKGHRFDIAIQALGGCDTNGAVFQLIRDLNAEDQVRFLPCEPARVYYYPHMEERWKQAGSHSSLMEAFAERFPGCSKSIKECYRLWADIYNELQEVSRPGSSGMAFGFSKSYPLLARYGGYTVAQFLVEMGIPKELQILMTARSGYCMLPPERLSLVAFACTEMTYSAGAWMVEGGVERIVRLLSNAVIGHGGAVKRNARAVKITTENKAVREVTTKDGTVYETRAVVLASAVRPGLNVLLDQPELIPPRYAQRMSAMTPSGSYYIGYYSVPAHAVKGLFPNMEVVGHHPDAVLSWTPECYYLLIPSLVDPTAAPSGRHGLCLSVPCPAGRPLGRQGRSSCRHFLENAATQKFPQLKGNLTFLFDMGPEQLHTITGNPGGSAYGWVQTPDQSGIKRLNIKTPIPGLYLAGHWTMPGGGIAAVVTSGRLCAQAILSNHMAGA